jgi:hypothetical protein
MILNSAFLRSMLKWIIALATSGARLGKNLCRVAGH